MTNSTDARLKMQQIDELIARGSSVDDAIAEIGVSQTGYTHWLNEHNGAVPVDVERICHLHTENARLRRKLAKLSLELKTARANCQLPNAFDQTIAA